MEHLVTTKHDDYIVAYAHHLQLDDKLLEYLCEIYCFFEDSTTLLPMFVFFHNFTLIMALDNDDNETSHSDLEMAGLYSKAQRPQNPKKYNIYQFDLDDECCSIDATMNSKKKKTLAKINKSLDWYFSDARMITTSFDVLRIPNQRYTS